MRHTRVSSVVTVMGRIWQPGFGPCVQDITVDSHEIKNILKAAGKTNISKLTRDDIVNWLETHTGDFQYIIDFRVDFSVGKDDLLIPWAHCSARQALAAECRSCGICVRQAKRSWRVLGEDNEEALTKP